MTSSAPSKRSARATILPALMPTSQREASAAVTTVPFLMMVSKRLTDSLPFVCALAFRTALGSDRAVEGGGSSIVEFRKSDSRTGTGAIDEPVDESFTSRDLFQRNELVRL